MTREEAIETLENHTQYFVPVQDLGALNTAISALRPVSREQVEKAEWIWSTGDVYTCSSCGEKTLRVREHRNAACKASVLPILWRSHDGRGRGDGDEEMGGAV